MFFILSKLLYFLLLPLTWFFGLMLVALFVKNKKRWIICAVLVLFVFSNKFLANLMVKAWELPVTKEASLQSTYEYAIILGGMSHYMFAEKRIVFDESSDRFWQTYQLYKTGRVKKLVITGGSGLLSNPEMKEALFLKDYLLSIGIPEQDLLIESESRNTHGNAINTARLFPQLIQQRVLLVTSAFHMRRALGCFVKEGYTCDTYTTDSLQAVTIGFEEILIPNSEALTTWGILIKELIGLVSYRLAGDI